MLKPVKFVVPVALLLLFWGCQEPPETAESVVQKVVENHGAARALRAADGLLFHGALHGLQKEEQAKVWILYRRPEKLRVIVQQPEAQEDRLYLQGKGWIDDGTGFTEVSGITLDLLAFQAEHLDLPFRLLEKEYQVSLLENDPADNLVRLALTDAAGEVLTISVDPARWVIRTVEKEFHVKGQTMKIGVVYEEYRAVKDVQLPLRILNFINGQPVGRTDFLSVQTNPSLPENVFRAPGAPEP